MLICRFFHTSILSCIGCLLATTIAQADVGKWPRPSQVDTRAFEQRFAEAFSHQPDKVPELGAVVECDLDDNHAASFFNLTEEAKEGMVKNGAQDITRYEVELDINRLDYFSTAEGCAALRSIAPERVNAKGYPVYRIPLSVKEPVRTHVAYEEEIEMIFGPTNLEADSETESDTQTLRHWPEQPAHPDYSVEELSVIIYSHETDSGEYGSKNYDMNFYSEEKQNGFSSSVKLSKTILNNGKGTFYFITMTSVDEQGRPVMTLYTGDGVFTTTVDGKWNGLRVTKNYFYAVDKSQEPQTRTCHDMGESVNVFKITGELTCEAVSEDMIGSAGVYVDAAYNMRMSAKKPGLFNASNGSKGVALNEERMAMKSERMAMKSLFSSQNTTKSKDFAARKKIDNQFIALQKSTKCSLSNSDWAYTGEQCKNGLAHGKGAAENRAGLKFIGTFEAGQRVKGEIHQNGNMIFAGNLIDDKPDGEAICFYENEYEECRFFKGKRIDTLYKVRKENAKHQEKMAKVQQARVATSAGSQQGGAGDFAVDALKREGASRAAKFIFDSLW